ncbi:MAG: sigma 54-interacting transcriptional regulator [Clostridia bacterium]|nr:sigma 54-interacting transcriptional regulator [Clostridia bacterium]
MAKAAILMPYPDLKDMAEALISQYPRITPMTVEYVQTSGIAARAKALEEKGCEIIIARGLQARLVRAAVLIPVIEMRASTQELAALVLELKQTLNAPEDTVPKLGIVGFFNMFHSTERFGELLGVELKVYTVTNIDQYSELVSKAHQDGCLGVIGGEVVGRCAEELGMAFCFLKMGEESMREALDAASLAGYSIDLMKMSNAEMSAMLDNTFSAIMQVDAGGVARRANRAFYHLLDKEPDAVIGRKAEEVIEDFPANELSAALREGQETDATLVSLGRRNALMSMTPVRVEDRIEGAILTFQESKRITEMDSRLRQERAKRGFVAQYTFDQIFAENKEFQHTISQLKRLSRYPSAVLLAGEPGTGKGILAQCIHNESLQRGGPFVTVDCSIWHPDDLDEKLFGRFSGHKDTDRSVVELARGGTLYLRQVELLSIETQHKLLQLAEGQYKSNDASLGVSIDVKLIISTEANLREKMLCGQFRKDLYYKLSALKVEIPPLRERREDIPGWFEGMLNDWCKKFARQIRLAADARGFLSAYDWPGNLDQMDSLCQRLVLLSEKRNVDEAMLRNHLRAMDSEPAPALEESEAPMNPKAAALLDLLNRCHGNREKAAAELGISKTTLWRRMKKYGIDRDLTLG